jgi:hypothetical protein
MIDTLQFRTAMSDLRKWYFFFEMWGISELSEYCGVQILGRIDCAFVGEVGILFFSHLILRLGAR